MNGLPEFWRAEIWHPLFVHIPLAILLVATLFYAIGFFSNNNFWKNSSILLLLIGTIGSWITIYTGNLADAEVAREICDPTVLEEHEKNAYIVGWLFSIASAIILLEYFGYLKKIKKTVEFFVLLLVITASGFLVYTGHLGATLVYQQAAGVYTPSEDCSEFTE